MKNLATGMMFESNEYGDITLKISNERGSFPVLIVENQEKLSAEEIGNQILDGFRYYIESQIFENAQTRESLMQHFYRCDI